jgi:hypothetical protein
MALIDEELAVAPGLVPHQRIERDEPEAVMHGESGILPLHRMLYVILVRDAPLPGLDEVCDAARE